MHFFANQERTKMPKAETTHYAVYGGAIRAGDQVRVNGEWVSILAVDAPGYAYLGGDRPRVFVSMETAGRRELERKAS